MRAAALAFASYAFTARVRPDPEHLEDSLLAELTDSGESGSTIVAYVLAN